MNDNMITFYDTINILNEINGQMLENYNKN